MVFIGRWQVIMETTKYLNFRIGDDKVTCDNKKLGKFHVLTKYIEEISGEESFGEWFIDQDNDGTSEKPIQLPYVNFHEVVDKFVHDFYQFVETHPEYDLTDYHAILENNGLDWDDRSMRRAEIKELDETCILALIMGAIRAERFCDGALLGFFEEGYMLQWLKRLQTLDQ